MALTRPRLGQLYSNVAAFSDPITTLNAGATSANVDVGFLFNRANGLVSNVALVWKESVQSFVIAYTDATGVTNTNVTVTSYANVTTGNITASGFFFANGAAFTSSSYGNTDVGAYLQTDNTVSGIQANIGAYQTYANSSIQTLSANIGTLVAGAPGALDTLFEIDAALSNNASFSSVMVTWLGNITTNVTTANTNIQSISSNLGAYQTYANTSSQTINANLGAYETYANTQISTINSNLGAYQSFANTRIQTIDANVGAYEAFANASLTSANATIQTISANLGAYELYGNTSLQSINSNLGAYQTYANTSSQSTSANIGAYQTYANTTNSSTQANLGAYQTYANSSIQTVDANLGTATTNITTLQSNAGTQQTQINSIVTNANANVAAYLPGYTGSLSSLTTLTTSGIATIGGNLNVSGNLNVTGTQTTFNTNNVIVDDSLLYIANNNSGDVVDIGIVGHFINPGYQHTGLVRDASDGVWKLFANVTAEPSTTVDFTNAVYSGLRVGALVASSATYSGTVVASTLNAGTIGNTGATLTGSTATFTGLTTLGSGSSNVVVAATTTSTSSTTGALVVGGGVGISGNLNVVGTSNYVSGSLGLGQASPAYKLDVYGTGVLARFQASSGNYGALTLSDNTSTSGVGLISNGNDFAMQLGGTERLRLTSAGALTGPTSATVYGTVTATTVNAGTIGNTGATLTGTLSTAAQTNITSVGTLTGLTVSGNINSTGTYGIRLNGASGTWFWLDNPVSNKFRISSGVGPGDYAMTYDSTGNVVINSTTSSVSSITGALVVKGGVGIAGQVTAGNIITTSGVYWANGAAYSSGSGSGGITFTTAATAPASPSAGNFWYDSSGDKLYQYINDGTSSSWVDQSFPTSFGNLTVANTLTVSGTIVGTTSNSNYALASNVSLYESVAVTTTNATHYPMLSGIDTGNTSSFTASTLTFNPSTGTLGATAINSTNSSSTTLVSTNFSSSNIRVSGGYISTLTNATITTASITSLSVTGLLTGKTNTGGVASLSNDSGSLSIRGDATNAAVISFHRPTIYAINMGLDTDNVFKIGGWSATGNVFQLTGAGVLTIASTITSTSGLINANNLLLQGDGTNAYVRPSNSGSLYLGANNTNIAVVNTTGIIPSANVTYNLGSSTAWWNMVYGKAVQAQYADLAEHYVPDGTYAPGTVVVFGGDEEITVSSISHDTRVAGVISTEPAYLMNSANPGVPVALTGRVPCYVRGPVSKGDRLVNIDTGVAGRLDPALHEPGCIIGKSLNTIEDSSIKIIEIAVGRY